MDPMNRLDELLVCRLDQGRKAVEPCTLVIFGASGDLTARKLIPALYHLARANQMPGSYRIVGVARRAKTDVSWRDELKEGVQTFSRSKSVEPEVWNAFASNISDCQGDISDPAAYEKLALHISAFPEQPLQRNLLF